MTTLGTFAAIAGKWLRANWPALLLPALVVELICLARPHVWHTGSEPWVSGWVAPQLSAWVTPWLEVALGLAVVAVVFIPVAAARAASFALLGYGLVGFFVAHYLLTWRPYALLYGVVAARSGSKSVNLVLPEAFAFVAAALWLLVVTGAPGGAAVRRAVRQLRGAGGERKTVPGLLLLPVLGLWEEAYANPLWYGSSSVVWPVFAAAATIASVVLVVRRPRVAAVAAVTGLIVFGLVLIICALSGADECHSRAETVQIGIGYAGSLLRATVADDGAGGADASRGTGLAGVERRLATFDGVLAVSSPPGGPTIVVLEVPCALAG